MTLAIKTCDVSAVLLADGWHEVEPGSFTLQRLVFTDADGIEHRKAARKLGYRFLEQSRSLGTLQTVVVAGPLNAILAVTTAAQAPPRAEQMSAPAPAPAPAPASVQESARHEAQDAEPVLHARERMQDPPEPVHRRPPETPVPLQERVPVSPPRYERHDGEPSVQVPASIPQSLGSSEPNPKPESSRRFEREAELPSVQFEVNVEDQSDRRPAGVPDTPTRLEATAPRPDLAPEDSTPSEMTQSRQMMPSILLRDEMERSRLARAGQAVSEGLPLNGLLLRRSVADADEQTVDG